MEQFEYLSSLGEGAYGQVWLCKMRDSGRKVAMKRFKEAHQDPEVMRLAMREIKLLKASQHHNVVQLMEAFRSRSGRVYMVMEYVERTLTQDLRKYSRGFPPALAKMISWQLLQAVSFLHKRKVVHRDLKPANILISSDNTVKICDFGFARTLHPKETADYTTYVVTRWYRPPEVLVNDDYGPKIDVWAIGECGFF
ncbi:kinase-like domain-containing protein [Dunaliella salina]|uniref:Kinase-like domain-containing protein n=1 Tax=Dunaliella salina TaxID=3046 RepID=A0ABQ7FYV2_DUNSA|nr:kinase-like domain-containing protein [Dunaliella salina]|eukprot:KAF5827537.1 kinase-like domain-containing protein [Dunaliella salina]